MPSAGSPHTEGATDVANETEPAVEEVFDGFEEDSPEEIIAMADDDGREEATEDGFDAAVTERFVGEDDLVPDGETPAGEADAAPAELADRDADVLFGG